MHRSIKDHLSSYATMKHSGVESLQTLSKTISLTTSFMMKFTASRLRREVLQSLLHLYGKNASRVIGGTGTLLPHSPLDAFAIYRAVDPGVFGTHYIPFRSRYAVLGGFEGNR